MLSAKLARGMDGSNAWDDGAIVWRERESPASQPQEVPKKEASVKPKLFGPGLAVFDKVADPTRMEVSIVMKNVFFCFFTPQLVSLC